MRIAQKLPGEENDVGLAASNDRVGLLRRRDHANGTRRDTALPPHSLRESDLVARANWDPDARDNAAAAAVDEIHAVIAKHSGQANRVVDRPTILMPIAGRNPHEEGEMVRPDAAHGRHDLAEEPCAILE